jgi:glycerol transport system ATP-binding protein
MPTLRIEGVEKSFSGEKVLDNISLEVQEGTFTTILGPAGAGKTTLMKIIAGTLKPERGKIYLGEKEITAIRPRFRKIAMISQGYNLYPNLTVFENIASPLRAERHPDSEVEKRVTKQADILRIQHLLKKQPHELSGGEAQRVALGRALVRDADIFLLDEPLTGLDYKLQEEMTYELKEILKVENIKGAVLLYGTPNYEEALSMSKNTILMGKGKVLWYGDTLEGYRSPPSLDFAKYFYSPSMNLFDCSLKKKNGNLFLVASGEVSLPATHLKHKLKEEEYVLGLPTHAFHFERQKNMMEITFTLTLADVTPAGTVLHMEFDGKRINGYIPFPKDLPRGSLQLFVDPEDFFIFMKKSGLLITKYRSKQEWQASN